MDQKKALIVALKEFIWKVKKKVKVEQIILFGSRARGTAKKTSDIDLLIISKDFEKIKSFKRAQSLYLLWNQPYDIDLICLTPQELNKKQHEIGLVQDALKEGISFQSTLDIRRIKAIVE